MESNLRREDAEAIVKMLLLHSKDFIRFIEERKDKRSMEEFIIIKKLIGNLMGSIYFEVIEVIEKEHKGVLDELSPPMSEMNFDFPKLQE